jgi:hypothetical protein
MRGKLSAFIVCLVISGFLWLSHRLNQTYYYSIDIPVKFINLPSGKTLLNELPDHLRFDIKTNGLKLFFVLLNKPFGEITVDFNTLKGDNKFQAFALSYGHINLKSVTKLDVDIKKISPDTLYFSSKKGVTRNVPVKPAVFAHAEQGYVISKPQITPAFITISGDDVSVNGVDSVVTVPLYLNQVKANFNGKLNLVQPSENVFLNIHEVNVSIQADRLLEKVIDLDINAMNVNEGYTIKFFPGKVKITYSAAKNDFENITFSNIKAIANYSKKNQKRNKLPVELINVPHQVKVLEMEPQEVEFLVVKTK